jgi:hypothetical protein
MGATKTVYVQLLDEGIDVWRPVEAEYLGGDRYRLIGAVPEDEVWPFAVGDVVKCEVRRLRDGRVTVAYEKSN